MKSKKDESYWRVYIVRCADGTLYTGITTDIARRVQEHNGVGPSGSAYTASRRPVTLVWETGASGRSTALRAEYFVRTLPVEEKNLLVQGTRRLGQQDVGKAPYFLEDTPCRKRPSGR